MILIRNFQKNILQDEYYSGAVGSGKSYINKNNDVNNLFLKQIFPKFKTIFQLENDFKEHSIQLTYFNKNMNNFKFFNTDIITFIDLSFSEKLIILLDSIKYDLKIKSIYTDTDIGIILNKINHNELYFTLKMIAENGIIKENFYLSLNNAFSIIINILQAINCLKVAYQDNKLFTINDEVNIINKFIYDFNNNLVFIDTEEYNTEQIINIENYLHKTIKVTKYIEDFILNNCVQFNYINKI